MSTFLGIIAGVSLLFIAIFKQGGVGTFISISASMITLGGTMAAILISFPFNKILAALKAMIQAFMPDIQQPSWVIAFMIELSIKSRRDSLLSIEDSLKKTNDSLIHLGIEMVLDGHSPELIRDVMETELDLMESRHEQAVQVFKAAARFSPAFGLIGTLIGLIAMLRGMGDLDDMGHLGVGMAVALITTFYGAMLANLFFNPVAEKLKSRTHDESLRNKIIIEGTMMVQAGMNPRIIEKKLNSFLPPILRAQHYKKILRKEKI